MASEAEKWPPRSPEVTASKLNVQFFLTHSTWYQVSRRSNNEVMGILSLPMLNKIPYTLAESQIKHTTFYRRRR